MIKYSLLVLAFIFSLASNKKDNTSPDVLAGNWELVEVFDKSTSTFIDFPQGGTGKIIISFNGSGGYSGKTLKNIFNGGTYSIQGEKEIIFGTYTSTLATEDEWGGPFFAVLSSCILQSFTPCSPATFFIKNGLLSINSPLRYNIKLQKIP